MSEFRVGDRVHPKNFYPDKGMGTITHVSTEKNCYSGVTYLCYEVEYDTPIDGVWPYLARRRYRGYFCGEALERV